MPHIKTKEVFYFDELDDDAKEKARDWYREGGFDYDWWDCTFEDAATIADLFGLNIRTMPVKLMGGGTRHDPAIFFQLHAQGSGACFEGDYSYKKGALKAVKAYAPKDTELHEIVKNLQETQRGFFYGLSASISVRGNYSHSNAMHIDIDVNGDVCNREVDVDTEDAITECLGDFARWTYKRLNEEWDYQTSDEQIDEAITINEYEFTENGHRA